MEKRPYSKPIAKAVINSFSQGVIPSKGLGHVAVGRKQEITSVDRDITNAKEGIGSFRFIVGRYGSGKSFMLSLIKEHAVKREMVVMKADLSENALFSGTKKGITLYRELVAGMSVSGNPDGGAMEVVLRKWIEGIKADIAEKSGKELYNVSVSEVIRTIRERTVTMSDMPHYTDFISIVTKYYMEMGDSGSEMHALKWLKGEYEQKLPARKDLDIGIIIDDNNWYKFIKIWSEFVTYAGYKGLVLMFDEGVEILKLGTARAREKNYEKILTIYNDITQNADTHIAAYLCGTPDFVDDEARGVRSYAALYSRISGSKYVQSSANPFAVTMYLNPLTREEVIVLLITLRDMHSTAYSYEPIVTNDDIGNYMDLCYRKVDFGDALTPRQLSREFIPILDALYNDPGASFKSLVNIIDIRPDSENLDLEI